MARATLTSAVVYRDPRAALKFLEAAFGFELAMLIEDPQGALVSESEWASVEETLYLLRSPANAARLLDAVRGLEAGGGDAHELIEPED